MEINAVPRQKTTESENNSDRVNASKTVPFQPVSRSTVIQKPYIGSLKAVLSLLTVGQLTLATNQLIENTVIISLNSDWFHHPESRFVFIFFQRSKKPNVQIYRSMHLESDCHLANHSISIIIRYFEKSTAFPAS